MPKRTDPAITARLDPGLMAWVDETARLLDMSRGAFVRAILKELSEIPADDQGIISCIVCRQVRP